MGRARRVGSPTAGDYWVTGDNRGSARVSAGVAPFVTTCFEPHTVAAGVTGSTWWTTSQSQSARIAARC